jgi:hypothetical protein
VNYGSILELVRGIYKLGRSVFRSPSTRITSIIHRINILKSIEEEYVDVVEALGMLSDQPTHAEVLTAIKKLQTEKIDEAYHTKDQLESGTKVLEPVDHCVFCKRGECTQLSFPCGEDSIVVHGITRQ